MNRTNYEQTIESFLQRLASTDPAPGGGAAAALTGALAAALGEMVCGLTVDKPRYAPVKAELRGMSERFAQRRRMLMALIDGDAKAYAALSSAFKLDKSDPKRRKVIEGAALHAAAIPLMTANLARRMMTDLERLREAGNRNLAADVESAVAMAGACVAAALANARANVPLLTPEEAERVLRQIDEISSTTGPAGPDPQSNPDGSC